MAFATKPKINKEKAAEFVQAAVQPVTSSTPPQKKEEPEKSENEAKKIVPYTLKFPSPQMHQETKMSALKAGKNLRSYILDLIKEENKKYI